MLAGRLAVETFNYGVADAEFPVFDDGVPMMDGATGKQKVAPFKLLVFEVLPGLEIEFRIREEQWDEFTQEISGSKLKLATLADIPR